MSAVSTFKSSSCSSSSYTLATAEHRRQPFQLKERETDIQRERMGGRGRSRTQRKHFREGRENVWKRSKSDGSAVAAPAADANTAGNVPWEPFKTQNLAFDEYYKVRTGDLWILGFLCFDLFVVVVSGFAEK